MGLKIYGSPWQPDFSQSAFSLQRGDQLRNKWEWPSHTLIYLTIRVLRCPCVSLQRWANIPEDVQVLVTHAPPLGVGDLCNGWGGRAGDRKWKLQNARDFHFFNERKHGLGGTSRWQIETFTIFKEKVWKDFFATSSKVSVSVSDCEELQSLFSSQAVKISLREWQKLSNQNCTSSGTYMKVDNFWITKSHQVYFMVFLYMALWFPKAME